jgi:hypothetical protein
MPVTLRLRRLPLSSSPLLLHLQLQQSPKQTQRQRCHCKLNRRLRALLILSTLPFLSLLSDF